MHRFQVIASLTLAGWVLLGAAASPVAAQEAAVTKVVAVASPKTYTGICPVEITFTGTISVDRHPVTVVYRWERSDGAMGPRQKVQIQSAGLNVRDTWKLGTSGNRLQIWEKLHVLTPTGVTSGPAVAKFDCL